MYRAKAVVEFRKGTDKQEDEGMFATYLQAEFEAVNYWIDEFLAGNVTEEILLSIVPHWQARRRAFNSLPAKAQNKMQQYEPSKIGRSIDANQLTFLKTSEVYLDGDIIAQLVGAGIYPIPKYRIKAKAHPELKDEMIKFGESVLKVLDSDKVTDIIDYWLNFRFFNELRDFLGKAAEGIKLLREAEVSVANDEANPLSGFIKKSKDNLYEGLIPVGDPAVVASFVTLLKAGIYPTDAILAHIQKTGEKGMDELLVLKAQTAAGNFDPANSLQKELEFSKFLTLAGLDDLAYARQVFNEVEFKPDQQDREFPVGLTPEETMEARAASYEAALFYHFIKDRVDQGRSVIVIGNRRYGELFVVRPLEKLLAELNLEGRKVAYISSSNSKGTPVHPLFEEDTLDKSFIESLVSKYPDVVFVDGTPNHKVDDHPRFPSSAKAFMNWFLAYNEACTGEDNSTAYPKGLRELDAFKSLVASLKGYIPDRSYTISHYLPVKDKTIVVGDFKTDFVEPGFDSPQAIIANPVVSPSDYPLPSEFSRHYQGYLDDPEQYTSEQKVIVFGKDGIRKIRTRPERKEEEFVTLIHAEMERALKQAVRATSTN